MSIPNQKPGKAKSENQQAEGGQPGRRGDDSREGENKSHKHRSEMKVIHQTAIGRIHEFPHKHKGLISHTIYLRLRPKQMVLCDRLPMPIGIG